MKSFALLTLALLTLAILRWCFLPHARLPRSRARRNRLRLLLRLHPGRGHATLPELWLHWGRFAAFRRSRRSRRSMSGWQRLLHPDEHSLMLGRAHYGHGLRIPVEEHVLVMAPPRTGKTGLLARMILHYPGPVVSTTTKADVFELTSGTRSQLGAVDVFNPQSIGGVPSTFRWNPLDGCIDEAVAIRRADGFANAVSMTGTEDASFWSSKASSYLRGLFHAAALAGGDMRLVVAWALGSAEDAEDILFQAGATQWALELGELRGDSQKTAATIKMVLSRALAFMTDPKLAQSVLPAGRARVRHRGVPAAVRDAVPDRRERARRQPSRPAVRGDGQRDPPRRCATRPGIARRPPRPAAADGVRRDRPDLPRPAADLARRLRRQRHPAHPRRARRSAAAYSLATRRRSGRHGHLRGEGLAARHLRHRDAQDGQRPVRPDRLEGTRASVPHAPRRHDARHDPPASRRPRSDRPRSLLTRPGPTRRRLEGPRLQGCAAARHSRRRADPSSRALNLQRPAEHAAGMAIPAAPPGPTSRNPDPASVGASDEYPWS